MYRVFLAIVLWLIPSVGSAVCGGASPTWVAASAGQTDVSDCFTAASSGDTIQVPAGTVTWSSALTMPPTKDLTLTGATNVSCSGGHDALPPTTVRTCTVTNLGSGTEVTCGSGNCLIIPQSHTYTLSGFRFLSTGTANQVLWHRHTSGQVAGKATRVHHNSIEHTGASYASIDIFGEPTVNCSESPAIHPSVLYDNNLLLDTRIEIGGTACSLSDGPAQHRLWFQDARPNTPTGTWPEILFVEDNEFRAAGGAINAMDCNYGGRYTFRFNGMTGTAGQLGAYLEIHGEQGVPNRACPWKEIYANMKSGGLDNFFGLAFIRSGSGVVFANRVGATAQVMRIDDQRSWRTDGAITRCDGTSAIDGNTAGMHGYPCRDQIGRIRDASFTGDETAPQTEGAPLYFWQNFTGSGTTPYVPDYDDTGGFVLEHVVQNRDWYTEQTTFDGTAGVGIGTLAARPATCTTGVSYWATDQGEWDSTHAGADGQLYKCTAPNTWAVLYIPYPYPHPLQGITAVVPTITRIIR